MFSSISGKYRDQLIFAAGYRCLPHSQFGCRTNATATIYALALHPTRRTSGSARKSLDKLQAQEQRQSQMLEDSDWVQITHESKDKKIQIKTYLLFNWSLRSYAGVS